ncbi:hypothetical protein HKX48_006334 [Thoreauomyces humboldtii]|nr:hypothetical protein HKX48_006334 [Thoreauomyces humboldtii]
MLSTRFSLACAAVALLAPLAAAQEGAGGSAPSAIPAGYSCDPTTCKLPACYCASAAAPIANPPQFLMLTFDDSVQQSVWGPPQTLLAGRKNPNGCPAKATWFAQVFYSDPYLVQTWYAQGNEIADHTIDHVQPFAGTYQEVEGMRKWANELAGIPLGKIKGFRYPYLNYSSSSLSMLSKMGFEWESSMSAGSAVGGDAVWPYTLDHGTVNDCLGEINLCGQQLNANGLWEVPMYGVTGTDGAQHLMDPYNDPTIFAPITTASVTAMYQTTFDAHYASTRVPFGVYTHPVWLTATSPGATATNPSATIDGTPKLQAIAAFLDYAMAKPDTWMITPSQLIEYMKNPVSAADLAAQPYMSCTPNPPLPTNICNGVAGNTTSGNAAPETCNLLTGTFRTCYGCPPTAPTLADPSPASTDTTRKRLPTTCDSLWWDPVAGSCTCTAPGCAYTDTGRPINMDPNSINVANTTASAANATGTSSSTTPGSSGTATRGAAKAAASSLETPLWAAMVAVAVGLFV